MMNLAIFSSSSHLFPFCFFFRRIQFLVISLFNEIDLFHARKSLVREHFFQYDGEIEQNEREKNEQKRIV